ncbi:dolichyl-phosphate mannosyltransferase polypeptide 2, regulatory subunit [Aphanomyces euteiches]|nr:dolichyl-phosphate mannosyltransferase polypeptide 2, regulatory subunit [Aphanomyces euteiches]
MGGSSDQSSGAILLAVSVASYIYYALWVFVTPFVDKDHAVQSFFPERYYAMAIPSVLLVVFLTVCSTFIGLVMIRSKPPKTQTE